jgi:hypothetical protein
MPAGLPTHVLTNLLMNTEHELALKAFIWCVANFVGSESGSEKVEIMGCLVLQNFSKFQ